MSEEEQDHSHIIEPIHKALTDALEERDELEERIANLEKQVKELGNEVASLSEDENE